MNQQKDYKPNKNIFKKKLELYLPMALVVYCLSGEKIHADSTFFPENSTEVAVDKTSAEDSNPIKEWAKLKPPNKETSKLIPTKKEGTNEVSQSQPQEPTPGKSETQNQQPLALTTVESHPKALPVHEKGQTSLSAKGQGASQKTVISYADAVNGRSPLGILEPHQEVHNQKWYIYSSAIRGLKNPSDNVQIVNREGVPPNRGEEIKNLLVEMGVEPEKIQIIHTKGGEEKQAGYTFIFAGK